MNRTIVSTHFTRKGAEKRKTKLAQEQEQRSKRSSGWARIDYVVTKRVFGFKKHMVIRRSV